jgi:hypothetical protein
MPIGVYTSTIFKSLKYIGIVIGHGEREYFTVFMGMELGAIEPLLWTQTEGSI